MYKKLIEKIKTKIWLYKARRKGLELNMNKWKNKPVAVNPENCYIGKVRLSTVFQTTHSSGV